MNTRAGFVFKVIILSAAVSVLIKYAGPYLPVTATATNALATVMTPTTVVILALLGRMWKSRQLE